MLAPSIFTGNYGVHLLPCVYMAFGERVLPNLIIIIVYSCISHFNWTYCPTSQDLYSFNFFIISDQYYNTDIECYSIDTSC